LGVGRYRVRGEITIRDRTHGTVFQVDASPPIFDGQDAAGTGECNRHIFQEGVGLACDRILRFGGFLVADEVSFS
jgi:hypothetical protein